MTKKSGTASLLKDELRTKKHRIYTLTALIAAAVFLVSFMLGFVQLSFAVAYLTLTCMIGGALTAIVFAVMAVREGSGLRATMKRLGAQTEEAYAQLHGAKVLYGGPVRLSEKYLFAKGMGVCAPLSAVEKVEQRASGGKDQDVFSEMWLTLRGEKKPVLVMREEVGYVNRGLCDRAAAFMRRVVENGGELPAVQKEEKPQARAARASAKELRTLLSALGAEGLPQDRAYSLWLRGKDSPEEGGAQIARRRDGRLVFTGETEGIRGEEGGEESGAAALSREKAAALGRERADAAFVLEEAQENGRIRVYRLTSEQFLQLEKHLFETGRVSAEE